MNEQELQSLLAEQGTPTVGVPMAAQIGLLLGDPVHRRLLEGLSVQLELLPVHLDFEQLNPEQLLRCELIVADADVAPDVRARLEALSESSTQDMPALVAVQDGQAAGEASALPQEATYEGILRLPAEPALVTAQLGIILYAHRAFVRRYHSAMEELQLNRRIFRSVTSGITVARVEPGLPLVYVNPAFEVITGFSIEEALGQNCRFLQRDMRDQPGLTLIREALRAGRETHAIVRNYRKNGTPFWNELSISAIRNHEGKLTHFVGIQQDVTARVEFEEALRESEKLATAGRLAASIAHEINNPLEAITNLIYLARQATDLAEVEEHLAVADDELRRVALLTSQSLRFYKQSTAPTAVRPSDLLDSVLDVYARRLEAGNIRVERRERMCDSVVCFESELRQVLSNLVRNAMDAMPAAGGRLLVRTREGSDWTRDLRGVLVTIGDTGNGIPRETMGRIFEAFYSTKGNNGTGLGLWVTREIVARHKGTMRVRSSTRPGASWTVFQLFLPFQGATP